MIEIILIVLSTLVIACLIMVVILQIIMIQGGSLPQRRKSFKGGKGSTMRAEKIRYKTKKEREAEKIKENSPKIASLSVDEISNIVHARNQNSRT